MRLSATTSERPNPGDELGECDRLRQIVVRAELETGDARLKPPGGGDHQNLRARPAPDEGRAQLVPVELGKVAVEHDHVVVSRRRVREPAQRTVHEEHRGTSAEPFHRHRRNRHCGVRALVRIRWPIFAAAPEQLPDQCSEQEAVEPHDRA